MNKETFLHLQDLLEIFSFYRQFNCAICPTGCVFCHRFSCPQYREICLIISKIGPIFVREHHRSLKEIESIFRDLLEGSQAVKALAFKIFQEAVTKEKALDNKTIGKLKRFRKNSANREICEKFTVH